MNNLFGFVHNVLEKETKYNMIFDLDLKNSRHELKYDDFKKLKFQIGENQR